MDNFTRSLRRLSIFVLLNLAVILTWSSNARAQYSGDVSEHPWIGKAAPDFELEKVGGGKMKLKDLEGKYVVIHFGASW